MKKIASYMLFLGASVFICLGIMKSFNDVRHASASTQLQTRKLRIVTTLFPLFDFTKNLTQGSAEVLLLMPANADPHNYEPRLSEIIQLNKADLIIYAGAAIEPHVHRLLSVLENKKAAVLDISKCLITTICLENSCCEKFHLRKKNPQQHKHAPYFDPHVWLDFDNVAAIVRTIANALARVDPEHASSYEKNSIDYIASITALDRLYREKLSAYEGKKIIHAGHYSFGYLARRYGIDYTSVQDPFAESELRASSLIKAIEEVKKIGARYIFHEEQEGSTVTNLLEKETGALPLLLNSVHSAPAKKNSDEFGYISIMEENLKNLIIALQPQRE